VTGSPNSQLSTGSLRPCVAGSTGCSRRPIPTYWRRQIHPRLRRPAPQARPTVVSGRGHLGEQGARSAVHEFDAILERQLSRNTVVSVSYLGSQGRRLPFVLDKNLPTTATGSIAYTISGGPDDGDTPVLPLYGKATTANNGRPNPAFDKISALEYIGSRATTPLCSR